MYVFVLIILFVQLLIEYTFPPTTVGVYKLVVSSPSGAKVEKQLELTVLGEGETVDAEDLDFSSVPVAQFGAYVNDYHNNSNEKFRDHYKVYHHVYMYHYKVCYNISSCVYVPL